MDLIDAQRQHVAEVLRLQAMAGSRWNAVMLEHLAVEVEEGGPASRALAPIAHLGHDQAPALRLLGGAHRLALSGEAPAYAAHAPTCGGDGDAEAAWPALRELCASRALDDLVLLPVQTNEPRRAAALLPGFAHVQAATGLPLRLREIGSSAGLLLRVDRYRYEIGGSTWGDPTSPVRLRASGEVPLGPVDVVDRRGCDVAPLDPVADRTRLLGWIWADEVPRFEVVAAALDLAARHPVDVDRVPASEWLADLEPQAGTTTIVFHSIMWQYLPREEKKAVAATLAALGERATPDAPVAWLTFEPHKADPSKGAELGVTIWPGGERRVLAMCGYHGDPVAWFGAPGRMCGESGR